MPVYKLKDSGQLGFSERAPDISNASEDQEYTVIEETNPRGFKIAKGGEKLYIVGFTDDGIQEYSLSTAWDISSSSISWDQEYINTTATNVNLTGIEVIDDPNNSNYGKKFYTLGTGHANKVTELTATTAWDVSTITSYTSYNIANRSSTSGVFEDIRFMSPRMFFLTGGTSTATEILKVELSSDYDLSTAKVTQSAYPLSYTDYGNGGPASQLSLDFSPRGNIMYFTGPLTSYGILQFRCNNGPYDISNLTWLGTYNTSSQTGAGLHGIQIKPDNQKIFTLSVTNDQLHRLSI